MNRHLLSTTVEVDVDISTDDLTDDDLRELCKERGITVGESLVEELHRLFKLKQHDAILERMRLFVQDAKGVVL
jgi:hypothetical protein